MSAPDPASPAADHRGASRSALSLRLLQLAARLEVPGAFRLLGRAGVRDDARWAGAPRRETRGLWHGYRMRLDLADYHQRGAYFYGRLLDLSVQAFMMLALRPGDDCIDLGSNIGLLTLAAAAAVGPSGRVLAVEPNPEVFEHLQRHLRTNRIGWATPVCAAASDRTATMTLSVPPTGNTAAGTLGRLRPIHGNLTSATHEVPLEPTDAMVLRAWGADSNRPLLVKVDVEGHETAALRGLARTIETRRPIILAELNDYMLSTNGSSSAELMSLLRDWGYRAYRLRVWRTAVLRRPRVELHDPPADWPGERTVNVVLLSANSPPAPHIARLVRA